MAVSPIEFEDKGIQHKPRKAILAVIFAIITGLFATGIYQHFSIANQP